MGPVKPHPQGAALDRSVSRQPVPQRPPLQRPKEDASGSRQGSFRCLDAMLCDSEDMGAWRPASPERAEQKSSPTSPQEPAGNSFKLRQLFKKKTTPPPEVAPDRESFFCADARAIEEAFGGSRDRYDAAAIKTVGGARGASRPAYEASAPPLPVYCPQPTRSLMAEAMAQRAITERRAHTHPQPVRQARRPAQQQAPIPPVPPLPEQYRQRAVAQRG